MVEHIFAETLLYSYLYYFWIIFPQKQTTLDYDLIKFRLQNKQVQYYIYRTSKNVSIATFVKFFLEIKFFLVPLPDNTDIVDCVGCIWVIWIQANCESGRYVYRLGLILYQISHTINRVGAIILLCIPGLETGHFFLTQTHPTCRHEQNSWTARPVARIQTNFQHLTRNYPSVQGRFSKPIAQKN